MMFRRVTIVLLCLSGSPLDVVFAETQRDSPRSYVFTDAEIAQCTRMRTPNLVHNPKTGSIHMAVRCCGKNRCAHALSGETDGVLRDNLKDCKVGLKTSKDGGRTWGGWQIVSGALPGYGHGSPLWDVKRERIVLQYQSFLSSGGATKPTSNTSYYQIVSEDDAVTWSAPRDISHFFEPAQKSQHDMMDITAGNKVRGNEVSVAVQDPKTGELIMDGRGQSFSWFPNRAVYYSKDDGTTWSDPQESPLLDPPDGGCQRALISHGGVLYTSEPQRQVRHQMVLQCSQDGGKSYPWRKVVTSFLARGGYSDLKILEDGKLLMVWEDYPTNNIFSQVLETSWCGATRGKL